MRWLTGDRIARRPASARRPGSASSQPKRSRRSSIGSAGPPGNPGSERREPPTSAPVPATSANLVCPHFAHIDERDPVRSVRTEPLTCTSLVAGQDFDLRPLGHEPDRKASRGRCAATDFARNCRAEALFGVAWLALREARAAEAAIEAGNWIDPSQGKITFRDYVEQHWWPSRHLEVSTKASYRCYLDKHFLPFGEMPMRTILPSAVQAWVTRAATSGLSARSVVNEPRTLRISNDLVETLSRQVASLDLSPEQLLFSSTGRADGNPISRNTFRTRVWLPVLERSQLGFHVRFHDLRHAHASRANCRWGRPEGSHGADGPCTDRDDPALPAHAARL
jgi:hypothetical protein